MKRLVILVAVLLVARDSYASELDDTKRLEAGEVIVRTREVPGYALPQVTVIGLVNAPPEKVWPIVADCGRYKHTMPRTLESEELYRKGNEMRCRVTIDMPFPLRDLRAETDAIVATEPGRVFRRTWKLHEGDFRVNSGSWTLEPYAEGRSTKATYEALSQPDVPLPQFVLDMALEQTVPSVIENLRKQVE